MPLRNTKLFLGTKETHIHGWREASQRENAFTRSFFFPPCCCWTLCAHTRYSSTCNLQLTPHSQFFTVYELPALARARSKICAIRHHRHPHRTPHSISQQRFVACWALANNNHLDITSLTSCRLVWDFRIRRLKSTLKVKTQTVAHPCSRYLSFSCLQRIFCWCSDFD